MAIIKSFTSLEQSKKLAEILPLESADMYYPNRTDVKYQGALSIGMKHGNPLLSQEILCWSLAALLDALPKQIHNNGLWWLQIDYIYNSVSYMGKDNSVLHYVLMDSDKSLVDVCYEMIIHLHELKML